MRQRCRMKQKEQEEHLPRGTWVIRLILSSVVFVLDNCFTCEKKNVTSSKEHLFLHFILNAVTTGIHTRT